MIVNLRGSVNAADDARNTEYKFELSEHPAIVEMRLRQLTGLEQEKLRNEYDELLKTISDLKDILKEKDRRMSIIKTELLEIKEKYGDQRRSKIEYAGGNFSIEDMIPDDKMVITISHAGYIKRTPLSDYKTQNRGGVGQKAFPTPGTRFRKLFCGTNHQYAFLPKKENVFGCAYMKFQRDRELPRAVPCRI